MEFRINFSDTDLPTDYGKPLPDGLYEAQIEKAEGKLSSNGNKMLVCEFTVLNTIDGEPVPGNRRVFSNFMLEFEAGVSYLMQFLLAAGYTEDQLRAEGWQVTEASTLIGQPLVLRLATESSEGYPDKNVVKAYLEVE